MSHAIKVHELTFPTIKAAAAHFNMPRETLSRKVNSGISAEEAIDRHLARKQKKSDARKKTITNKPVECAGRTFPSIAAFARAIKMPEPTVRGRMAKGESPDSIAQDAVLTAPPARLKKRQRFDVKKAPRLMINGERFPNANQMAADYDMPREVVEDRINRGWTPAQAVGLTPPPDGRAPTLMPIDFENKQYDSLLDLSAAMSINTDALVRRVDDGEDIVTAIEQLLSGEGDEKSDVAEPKVQKVATANTLSLRSHSDAETRASKTSPIEPELQDEPSAGAPESVESSHNTPAQRASAEVEYAGETYRSENALAAAYGVPIATFMLRRRQGKSLAEALGDNANKAPAPQHNSKRQPYMVHGQSYSSISAIARAYNIAAHRVRYCLQTNDDLEALLTKHREVMDKEQADAVDGKKRQPIEYRGKEYATITDLANAYGVKPNTLASRLRKNKPLAVALGHASSVTPSQGDSAQRDPLSDEPANANSAQYDALSAQASDTDSAMSQDANETVNARPHDADIAAVEDMQPQGEQYEVAGMTFYSTSALAEHFDLPAQRIEYRLSQGASVAEAVGHLAWEADVGQSTTLVIGHHKFPSIKAAATHFGVNYATLRRRLQDGMAPEAAVGAHLPDVLQVGEFQFMSVTHFAEHYRLDPDVTSRRLMAGWTPAEILGDVMPPKARYTAM